MDKKDLYNSIMKDVSKIVKKRLNESEYTEQDERDNLLDEIDDYLKQFRQLGLNTYQSGEAVKALNPVFGYPVKSSATGVQSVWMGAEADRISISVYQRAYTGDRTTYTAGKLKLKYLSGLCDFIRNLVENRKKEIESYKNNPPFEDFLEEAYDIAVRCMKAAGSEFSVKLKTGKRQYEKEEYKAFVVYEDGDQIGHVQIYQDDFGAFQYSVKTVMGGDLLFLPVINRDNITQELIEAFEYITSKRISL